MSRILHHGYCSVSFLVCVLLGMSRPADSACQPILHSVVPWSFGAAALVASDSNGLHLGVSMPSGLQELRTSYVRLRGESRALRISGTLAHTGFDRLSRYALMGEVHRHIPGENAVRVGMVMAVSRFVQEGAAHASEMTVGASATVEPGSGLRVAGRALFGPGRIHGARAARVQVAARMDVSRVFSVHAAVDRSSDDGASWQAGVGLHDAGPFSAMATFGSGARLGAASMVVQVGRTAASAGWWYSHPFGSSRAIGLRVALGHDHN